MLCNTNSYKLLKKVAIQKTEGLNNMRFDKPTVTNNYINDPYVGMCILHIKIQVKCVCLYFTQKLR